MNPVVDEDTTVKVKICGITSVADARLAIEAGADALGFVFYEPSPRYVTPEAAAAIVRDLPPFPLRVGVFVDAPPELVLAAMSQCHLGMLQFHGDEPPDYCLQFGLMTMKAFRVQSAESLQRLAQYPTDAWLLDACAPGKPGGSGETFNWHLALEAAKLGRPVFLAGGLTPENVAEAVRRVRPYGVDVSTGVESVPGRKDRAKVRAFIRAVRQAEGQGSPV